MRVDIKVNRFLIQGEGNIKYTFNNGVMAKDTETAAMNFMQALEKLPGYIKQEQKKIAELQKDVPILQELVRGTWKKKSRLSDLKQNLRLLTGKYNYLSLPKIKSKTKHHIERFAIE